MLHRLLLRSRQVSDELERRGRCAISNLARDILTAIDFTLPLWHLQGPYTRLEKILAHRVVELEAQLRGAFLIEDTK